MQHLQHTVRSTGKELGASLGKQSDIGWMKGIDVLDGIDQVQHFLRINLFGQR